MSASSSQTTLENIHSENLWTHLEYWHKIMVEAEDPRSFLEETEETRCYFLVGTGDPFENAVFFKNTSDISEDLLTRISTIYKERNTQFCIPARNGSELSSVLKQQGFEIEFSLGTIAGDLTAPLENPSIPEGFTVERIDDRESETMQQFLGIITDTFHLDKGGIEPLSHKSPKLDHWVTKNPEGEVVTTVSAIYQNQTISLWNLATLPKYRKQRLATHLMATALAQAKEKGLLHWYSFLAPSKNALSAMQRLNGQELTPFDMFYPSTSEK